MSNQSHPVHRRADSRQSALEKTAEQEVPTAVTPGLCFFPKGTWVTLASRDHKNLGVNYPQARKGHLALGGVLARRKRDFFWWPAWQQAESDLKTL